MKHPDSYSDSRYFYTSSLYLAAFLYAHDLWVSSAEKESSGQYRFAFRETPEREHLVRLFKQGAKAMVDARAFVYALEELQRRARVIRRMVKPQ